MPPRSLRIVSPRFGTDVVGGVETLLRRLALQLVVRAWNVQVLTTTAVDEATWAGDLAESEDDSGIEVRRFRPLLRREPRSFELFSRAFFRMPRPLRPEAVWIRAQGPWTPDLVRALSALPPGPVLAAPYLFHPVLSGLPRSPHPRVLLPAAHPERPLRLRAVGRAVAAADGLWYSTPEERALLEAVHPAAAAKPVAIGTTGIEPTRGEPGRFRRACDVDGPFLLYGGRQTRGKGLDVMLDGLRLLRRRRPEVRLVLTGEAPPGRGDGVLAVGRLEPQLLVAAIAAATAVVVPGTLESLSLLALEAWAARRPCLMRSGSAALAGQARRSGGALLFDDAAAFAEQASLLLEQPALADRLGEQGHDYVLREHSWDSVVERLERLLETAAHRRP